MKHTLKSIPYQLGETTLYIDCYQSKIASEIEGGLIYFHPHEDEITSLQQTIAILEKRGGTLYAIRSTGERCITFMMDGISYTIDPNRMFSRGGIAKNMTDYGACCDGAVDAVYQLAMFVHGLLGNQRVIAVHNTFNIDFNVHSYVLEDGTLDSDACDVYINPNQCTGNFIFTTNALVFSACKQNKLNAVLQSPNVMDDGSYSVFAKRQGIDYVNIEATRGDTKNNHHMIDFINNFYGTPHPYQSWKPLQAGDVIDFIAPSYAYDEAVIAAIKQAIEPFGLICRFQYAEQNPTELGYAHTDEKRYEQLHNALVDPTSKAIWAIRGGRGGENILMSLLSMDRPKTIKPIIGYSDITAMHGFVNGKWNIPSIHGIVASYNRTVNAITGKTVNDQEPLETIIDMLMGRVDRVSYQGLKPLNDYARNMDSINTTLWGGNATLVQSTLGTPLFGLQKNSTLILEDIGVTAGQIDRLLVQLSHSDFIPKLDAIILGQFSEVEDEPLTDDFHLIFKHFANRMNIPVFLWDNFGHNGVNSPLPLNTKTTITPSGNDYILDIQVR